VTDSGSWLNGILRCLGAKPRHRWLFAALVVGMLSVLGLYVYLQAPILWFVSVQPPAIPAPRGDDRQRILIVAPHPDDDVLGMGGTIAEAIAEGGTVLVVFLTSGDASQAGKRLITMHPFHSAREYRALGSRRQKEAVLALSRLGVPGESAVFLNYPDRGLTSMLQDHWLAVDPFRSPFTKRDSKYSDVAFNPGASYCGENLEADQMLLFVLYQPTIVYLPHPSDNHPDHHTGYQFAHSALEQSYNLGTLSSLPDVRCYMIHSFEGTWPLPRRLSPGLRLEVLPVFIAEAPWQSLELADWAVSAKLRAISAHFSQWWTSRRFLASFVRINEVYMPIPSFDDVIE
jgi:LmbE family N-acetylglucosaminyl deacetylase